MKNLLRPLLLIAFVLALATLAGADTGPAPVEPTKSVPPVETTESASTSAETADARAIPRLSPRTPLMVAIQAAFDEARVELSVLEDRAAGATDEMQFLDIQRQIEQLHQDMELRLLRVQLDHYRQVGNVAAAERIEDLFAKMAEPRPTPKRVERPASAPQSQR